MMEETPQGRAHREALQELDGPLRDAVEHLRNQPVPEEATWRAVDRYLAVGASGAKPRSPRRLWLAGAVAAAAAAALLTVLALWSRDPEETERPTVDAASLPSDGEQSPDEPLTLQKCRLALRESPEALVRLLDQHASTFFPSGGQPVRIGPRGWRDFVEHEIGEDL
jgi:hypothetical protein